MTTTSYSDPLALDAQTASTTPGAVSWAAVFAGAAAAASLSLILLILGMGLGTSSVSPWAQQGISATTFGVSAILWLTFTQLVASAAGGYIAGRLRSRWHSVHTDEVYFRDTAHGFLSWSVATLVTAAVLTSAVGAIVGSGVSAVGSVAGAGATAALSAGAAGTAAMAGRASAGQGGSDGGMGYTLDSLFRKAPTVGAAPDASQGGPQQPIPTPEVGRIFAQSLKSGELSKEDSQYIGQLIAARTGISQEDAEKRVDDAFAKSKAALAEAETKAREAADAARKASAYASLWLFVTLLIGAFSASLAATFGGRRRDLY